MALFYCQPRSLNNVFKRNTAGTGYANGQWSDWNDISCFTMDGRSRAKVEGNAIVVQLFGFSVSAEYKDNFFVSHQFRLFFLFIFSCNLEHVHAQTHFGDTFHPLLNSETFLRTWVFNTSDGFGNKNMVVDHVWSRYTPEEEWTHQLPIAKAKLQFRFQDAQKNTE
jgi:hypothetical protein